MDADGLGADEQLLTDLPVRATGGDESQHLQLPLGQAQPLERVPRCHQLPGTGQRDPGAAGQRAYFVAERHRAKPVRLLAGGAQQLLRRRLVAGPQVRFRCPQLGAGRVVWPAEPVPGGGRGPDVCIEAVGMEAHSAGPQHVYDQVKQQLRMQSDRPAAVREAIHACRKGGSVFVLGVFGGLVDKFPLGALMNKGLDVARSAAARPPLHPDAAGAHATRGPGHRAEHLATHVMPLEKAPDGYRIFKDKLDNNVRSVFLPH